MALCSTAAACQSCIRNQVNQTPDNKQPPDEFQDYRLYRQPNDYRAAPNYYQPPETSTPIRQSWNGPLAPDNPPPLSASYQRSTDHYNPYAFENYPPNYRP